MTQVGNHPAPPTPHPAMTETSLLVRFSETTLKGRNRGAFERRMTENIAVHLKPHGKFRILRERARATIESGANGGGDLRLAAAIVKGLPGVANLSLAQAAPRELEALTEAAMIYLDQMLLRPDLAGDRAVTFRVAASRKNKRYPLNSMELATHLGAAALERHPRLKVNLTHAELVLRVEIADGTAWLFEEKTAGPGGLAVGTGGKAVCLTSGGIDSPLAAYLLMTRGVSVIHLYFHSYPFIGEPSKEKVHDLVRLLARHQPASRLIVAPFAATQVAIRDYCPEGMRTILYRRFMNRVANRVAENEGAGALITGESVGQVASQTLQNIRVIEATAELPVLRPLIGISKTEIMERARRIGTYEISIQPFPDCCTLFQPNRPDTRAKAEAVERAEQRLPVEELVNQCLDGLEVTDYGPEYFPRSWDA